MMPRRLHILACAKAGSCALGPFSVGYTMSISGHLRGLTEFLRTTVPRLLVGRLIALAASLLMQHVRAYRGCDDSASPDDTAARNVKSRSLRTNISVLSIFALLPRG